MAYKIYQKLQSGMANQGLLDAADVDVMEDGQRVTLAEKLSGLSEDVAGMAEDVSDAVAVADGIKTAQGQEVGDVAETDIAEGVLIWHGGKLYRVLSLIAAGDHWQDMDVTETTVSEEINAMRGVSTEGVYLTITPASAIPAGGVKARIYNEASQTYLDEVTFTPASNRHLLGQIAYGDVYTIIMPSIDGYTQPADQTFKAGQMLRQRTVEYVTSQSNIEHLTITATCSDGAAIGDYDVTVRVFDGQGAVSATYLLPIEGGTSQSVDVPYGSNYTVTFPNISGYLTPRIVNTTAKASNRVLKAKYVLASGTALQWVVKNEETGEFDYYNTDYDVTGKDIFGMAVLDSTLLTNNGAFIIRPGTSVTTSKVWTNPMVDVPSATDLYNGESNTVNVLQAISDYETEHSTTVQSLFKDVDATNSGITVDGIPVKYFMAAPYQARYILLNISAINNLWQYYNAGSNLVASINPAQTSAQYNANSKYGVNPNIYQGYSKDFADYGYYRVLPIITVFDITT